MGRLLESKKPSELYLRNSEEQPAKNEVMPKVRLNPIMQDINKDGTPRYYQYPEENPAMKWNYGALPQTWEDCFHHERDMGKFVNEKTGKHQYPVGDNDPIDAIEIGADAMQVGQVAPVKVLGVQALIDDGETDWKLIVVRTDNEKFQHINTLQELLDERYGDEYIYRKTLEDIHDWLRNYKQHKGITNKFGFEFEEHCTKCGKIVTPEQSSDADQCSNPKCGNNGEGWKKRLTAGTKGETYAMKKVVETHEAWKNRLEANGIRELTDENLDKLKRSHCSEPGEHVYTG